MKLGMEWNPESYGREAAIVLAQVGDGRRAMPLVSPRNSDKALAATLRRPARDLFPNSMKPEAAHAGLWLYCGFFDESHSISQDIETPDGSYWHGILHRMEPDSRNAGYWFRRVGQHPLFPEVHAAAKELGYETGPRWDPFAFIQACDRAAASQRELLEQVQLAEWQLLFHHCAKAES